MVKTGGCCFQAPASQHAQHALSHKRQNVYRLHILCLFFFFTFFTPVPVFFFFSFRHVQHFKAVSVLPDSTDPAYTASYTVGIVLCSCDHTQHV